MALSWISCNFAEIYHAYLGWHLRRQTYRDTAADLKGTNADLLSTRVHQMQSIKYFPAYSCVKHHRRKDIRLHY